LVESIVEVEREYSRDDIIFLQVDILGDYPRTICEGFVVYDYTFGVACRAEAVCDSCIVVGLGFAMKCTIVAFAYLFEGDIACITRFIGYDLALKIYRFDIGYLLLVCDETLNITIIDDVFDLFRFE